MRYNYFAVLNSTCILYAAVHTRPVNVPKIHGAEAMQYNEGGMECIIRPLTKENYCIQFCQLLDWEEKEHEVILERKQVLIVYYIKGCLGTYVIINA